MLKFRNRQTGAVVAVPESDELAQQLAGVTHRGKPLQPELIKLAAKEQKRIVEALQDSWKWERVADTTPERPSDRILAQRGELPSAEAEQVEAEQPADEPSPAKVRAWAREQGIEVPARGALKPEVVEAYKAAHAQES